MSQLRQDVTTRQWVIIAPNRNKRPKSFALDTESQYLPDWDENCPFCPGNEDRTPPEISRIGDGQSSWRIRVVPNRYPALIPEGTATRRVEEGFFKTIEGVGAHEVIIESPLHNATLALRDVAQVEEVLLAYRDRYNALKRLASVRFISVFRNQGKAAGTSLEHPHSQVVATPIAPPDVRRKLDTALQYYDDAGSCLYCDLCSHELRVGKRVVIETENFLVFHPYASRSPFETWIIPKKHQTSFGWVSDGELSELAQAWKTTLLVLHKLLDNPDFNCVICSSPTEQEHNSYYDWHMLVVPRLTTPAGFEMGSGIHINAALPEETADLMREVRL
jgi:UDPglucose--hexose-1-phosphate uridylyltransferase